MFLFLLSGIEKGKIHVTGGCQYVSFSNSFTSGTPVRVFVSVNHGNESSEIHNTSLVWVEDVTTSRFRACVVRADQGFDGNITIDWFAFQGSQSGVEHGETRFTLFTTGTKCKKVTFYQVKSMFVKSAVQSGVKL